ncbi:FAD-binding oxidoreductase [Natronomonas gomsonensis]|uniref:ferredoxin--NADP reductase n=1 Tax=Natronomonas gomsonensis TaxID=1046043 RepID=UPI0032B2327B
MYSIASSPTHDELEFCVRRVPGGQMTSELAVDLEVGETVRLRGPYGELLLEEPSSRDVVFLATGTGVAPLKSMIDYLFETERDQYEGRPRDIWLFLGAAWGDTLPYREVFESYANRRDNFHFVPTVSRESHTGTVRRLTSNTRSRSILTMTHSVDRLPRRSSSSIVMDDPRTRSTRVSIRLRWGFTRVD